ncbi:MAG: prepilin-type N-terminal cleavage/methylation domain-containing protein [Cellvibrionaceae bacterium]|nr:prepilin-type N-terminal cleavage/methylation domain-containing protein [Cellvibrionaceae bacterium]
MSKIKGFTLIELVAVIVILGVITAISLPKFVNLQSAALSGTMQNLKAQIEAQANLANKVAIVTDLRGGTGRNLSISGLTVRMNHLYPNLTGMQTLLALDSSVWQSRTRNNSLYIWHDSISGQAPDEHSCYVRYRRATGANNPPQYFIELADCS